MVNSSPPLKRKKTKRKSEGESSEDDADQTTDDEPEVPKRPIFLINPKIIKLADTTSVYEEGCLSIPEYFAEVERPASVRVRYLDRVGDAHEIEADGLLATCLQHEIYHLDGTLFIDHISRLKRDMVIKRFTKVARQGAAPTGL